jgi:hypothetical protein
LNIPNNILKHYLRNVYFFCGTACGGKTTISKAFAEKHGLFWLDEDTLNRQMANIAEAEHQPAWCSRPTDWEVYFNRPYKEYHQWLSDCGNEMLPMELLELIQLSANRQVAVDMYNMPLQMVMGLTEPDRIVFLVTTPERVVRDYYDRPGHREIYDCIMGLRDPKAALANCNKMLAYGNQLFLDELYQSGLFYIMRDEDSTIEKTLALVEQHFGLNDGASTI